MLIFNSDIDDDNDDDWWCNERRSGPVITALSDISAFCFENQLNRTASLSLQRLLSFLHRFIFNYHFILNAFLFSHCLLMYVREKS